MAIKEIIFALSFFILLLPLVSSYSTPIYISVSCSGANYTQNSTYQTNLDNLLFSHLSSNNSTPPNNFFFNSTVGIVPNKVYGLYMCRRDITPDNCQDCINSAISGIKSRCQNKVEAIMWYDLCTVRYANRSIFSKCDTSVWFTQGPGRGYEPGTRVASNLGDYLGRMMRSLMELAAYDSSVERFALKQMISPSTKLYGMVQCTPDITDNNDCHQNLVNAYKHFDECCSASKWGELYTPSCNFRYSVEPFFQPSALALMPGKRKHALHLAINILISIAIPTFVLGSGIWIFIRKKKILETSKFEVNEIRTIESLEFDLNTIRAATHNFSMDKKLGEGGFGEVYKGMLKDGQEVAIKRLSKNSSQGIEEFKTEVELVAKLQHKNLVKLLGFCLASKEKILVVVYEFLQNSSLDHFLFDLTKKLSLDWEVRFKLIVGIARGLLYLHEDSRLKIIHRDLKPSNILLDEHMNPKISDFGLARLFGADQTQDDTKKIVGTYGYMAPEYAMTGHFSVKSDVYSFGIIVLEIISGQKNKFFGRPQQEEALLHRAWRLWNEGKGLDLVDTTLEKKYPKEEVLKCIQIGLLSIQENPIDRPTMATIVAALNGQSISLPLPKAPNFFGNVATTSNNCSPYYNSLIGENGIVYHPQLDQQGFINVYTGSDKITTLYPR